MLSSCSSNRVRRWRPFFFLQLCANTWDTVPFVWSECCLVIQNSTASFHLCATKKNQIRFSVAQKQLSRMLYRAISEARQKGIRRLSIRMNRTFQAGCYYRNLYKNRKQKFDSETKSCDTKLVIVCLRLLNEWRNAIVECLFLYWPFGKGELFVAWNWLGSRSLTENEYKYFGVVCHLLFTPKRIWVE